LNYIKFIIDDLKNHLFWT